MIVQHINYMNYHIKIKTLDKSYKITNERAIML